jgi:hypothetical protein
VSGPERFWRLRRPVIGFSHCDPETGLCYGDPVELPQGTEVREVRHVGARMAADGCRVLVRVVNEPDTGLNLRSRFCWVWSREQAELA